MPHLWFAPKRKRSKGAIFLIAAFLCVQYKESVWIWTNTLQILDQGRWKFSWLWVFSCQTTSSIFVRGKKNSLNLRLKRGGHPSAKNTPNVNVYFNEPCITLLSSVPVGPHVLTGPILVSVISTCWEIHPIMPLCLTSRYSVATAPAVCHSLYRNGH